MPKSVDEVFRDFVRYTGDGKPNDPVGKPLPIGDPASGVHHPPKADIRDALGGVYEAAVIAEDLVELATGLAADVHGSTFWAATRATLLANTEPSYTLGTVFATRAEGFVYQVLAPGATDHDLTTAGGVKLRYVPGPEGADPRAIGAPCNGVDDDAPFVETLFAKHKHVNLASGRSYVFASVIGLPDQGLYVDIPYRLTGVGAHVILDGVAAGDDILTSVTAKATPSTSANAFAGKLEIIGINFTQRSASVLVNGDRIYNILVQRNHFRGLTSVIRSFRARISSGYSNGYLQSVTLAHNHFVNVTKIVDAKRCYNFRWDHNFAEGCAGGIYIDGPDDAAIVSMSINGGLFEGGGLFGRFGKTLTGLIEGMYFEANTGGDTVTEKADIVFTGVRSQAVAVRSCTFQPTADQRADEAYYSIKDTAVPLGQAALSVRDCSTTGVRLFQPGRVYDAGGNVGPAGLSLNSRAPQQPGFARVSFITGRQERTNASHLSGGVYQIASISVSEVINRITNNRQRNACGTIYLMMEHRTAGGIQVGASVAVIDFVAMGTAAGAGSGVVNDAYMGFTLRSVAEAPSGQPLETTFSNTTKTHFSAPALSVVRSGNSYILSLSGYAAASLTNFGPATQMTTNITMQINGMNGSDGETTSLIMPG